MERYTELLYWLKYREHIHGYLADKESIVFDEQCPERAIKSFWAWYAQKDT